MNQQIKKKNLMLIKVKGKCICKYLTLTTLCIFYFFIYYMLEVDSTNQGQFFIYINMSLKYNLFI